MHDHKPKPKPNPHPNDPKPSERQQGRAPKKDELEKDQNIQKKRQDN